MTLPAFLETYDEPQNLPKNCVFGHGDDSLHNVHALWWPPSLGIEPTNVLIFIPGNPGLVDFYRPFLSALHQKSQGLAILAKAQIGHTPGFEAPGSSCTLDAQIRSASEAVNAVASAFGPQVQIILVGHSVGSYICTQLLKTPAASRIASVFLLFPTICSIQDTPNGRRLSWVFRPPIPLVISTLTHLARFLPRSILKLLFSEWPSAQLSILQDFIESPPCTFSALSMADEEMHTIRELDLVTMKAHSDKLWFYFAEQDDWVGANKELIITALGDSSTTQVSIGAADIPHAFCINHGEKLAEQCHTWILESTHRGSQR